MSWSNYVSGGVGPPQLAVEAAGGKIARSFDFPDSAQLTERFEVVSVRRAAVNGTLVDIPRGYRYRAKVKLPHVEVAWWRQLAVAFSAYRAGARLLFWPHADCPKICYAVVPAADFAFPYLAGKYLGYAGTLGLVGTTLLPNIPMTATWYYLCDAGETGYDPAEITFFTSVDETNYSPAEESFFSAASGLG